jgi:hypothetical protein
MRYRDQNGQGCADIIDLNVNPVKPVSPERSPTVIIAGYLMGRGMWRKGPSGRKPRHCSSRDSGFASTPDLAVGVPPA